MEEKIVKIEDISYEGAGVGRLDGKACFVPKTLVGEKVAIEIENEKNSYINAKLKKVLESSPDREKPFCPYFEICGGCAFQHMNEEKEKETKIAILKKEFAKINYAKDINFIENKNRKNYRNKLKLEIKNNKIGYFKQKTHNFFEINCCPIASQKINDAIAKVGEFLDKKLIPDAKNVYFKEINDGVAICFLFDKNAQKMQKNIKNLEFFNNFSIFFAFGDVLENNSTKIFHIYGKNKLFKSFDGEDFEVDVSSFNQVNDYIAEKLYSKICDFCKDKRVINAYSGQGLLTYLIAKRAKFVYGIEFQRSAHEKAEVLAKRFDSFKMQNICGRVEDELSKILQRDKIDLIVLDPAREGCKKPVLDAIKNSKIDEVIYISCNFSSFVRDFLSLKECYEIQEVCIFDMFPSCNSMEVFVRMKRA